MPQAITSNAAASRPLRVGHYGAVRQASLNPVHAPALERDFLHVSTRTQAPRVVNQPTNPTWGERLWRALDWLLRWFAPAPQPQPQPLPPAQPAPEPSPGTRAPGTPGISVYFTHAYASPLHGLSNEQVRIANKASTLGNPDNPDKQLVALIDQIPTGGTLDAAFFSIGVDNVTEAIIRAARRGVRVRLVTEQDYYTDSQGGLRPMIAKLMAAGVEVLPDDRAGLMHNKFLVANGQTVWTGSYNITEHGSYEENNNAMRLESAALAAAYTHEFEKMYVWRNFGPDRLNNTNRLDDHPTSTRTRVGAVDVEAFFSPYTAAQGGARAAILEEIGRARSSIQFLAFSFTEDAIADAMLARAAAGVKVEGVFEKSQAASRYSEYQRMNPHEGNLQGRLDVRLDTNPSLMHHKVIIIDDSTLVMGSYNFSQSAQSDNNENMLIFRNAPDLVKVYREEFKRIQGISNE